MMLLPIAAIRKEATAILWELLVPIHYRTLAELVFQKLGEWPLSKFDWENNLEHLREKLPAETLTGVFYSPEPDCCFAVRDWFASGSDVQALFNFNEYRIPGHAGSGIGGCFDALMRSSSMQQKNENASLENLNRARARGIVLERHVSDCFRERWPDFWLPADNEGRWRVPCGHDFKLRIGGKVFTVDAMGPRSDGSFGMPRFGNPKMPADIRFLVQHCGADVAVVGYIRQGEETPDISLPLTADIHKLIVILNCQRDGLDHRAYHQRANRKTDHA